MSESQEFWKKYHKDNDKPYIFSQIIKDTIKALKVKSILEIGCGLGHNLKLLEDYDVTGIDLSEYSISEAKKRFPQFKFYVGNVLKIPFEQKFDLVFTSGVIEHVKPEFLEQAFREMFRVSNRYILNIEAYDETEHEINWHRGRNESWTVHMAQRWSKFPVKIIFDYNVHKEYRLYLIQKI